MQYLNRTKKIMRANKTIVVKNTFLLLILGTLEMSKIGESMAF